MNRRRNQVSDCRLNYTAYGYLPVSSAEAMLGFNGQLLDRMILGYWLGNGHRSYAPSLMRFISSDQLSPFGEGGLNSYAYCAGDPINWVDPTGKAPRPGKAVPVIPEASSSTTGRGIAASPVAQNTPDRQPKIHTFQQNGSRSYKGAGQPIPERSASRTDIMVGGSTSQTQLSTLPISNEPNINQLGVDSYRENRPGPGPVSVDQLIPNHQRTLGGGQIEAIENSQAETRRIRNIQILSSVGHDPT